MAFRLTVHVLGLVAQALRRSTGALSFGGIWEAVFFPGYQSSVAALTHLAEIPRIKITWSRAEGRTRWRPSVLTASTDLSLMDRRDARADGLASSLHQKAGATVREAIAAQTRLVSHVVPGQEGNLALIERRALGPWRL
jgi:hypothetical protein